MCGVGSFFLKFLCSPGCPESVKKNIILVTNGALTSPQVDDQPSQAGHQKQMKKSAQPSAVWGNLNMERWKVLCHDQLQVNIVTGPNRVLRSY